MFSSRPLRLCMQLRIETAADVHAFLDTRRILDVASLLTEIDAMPVSGPLQIGNFVTLVQRALLFETRLPVNALHELFVQHAACFPIDVIDAAREVGAIDSGVGDLPNTCDLIRFDFFPPDFVALQCLICICCVHCAAQDDGI